MVTRVDRVAEYLAEEEWREGACRATIGKIVSRDLRAQIKIQPRFLK